MQTSGSFWLYYRDQPALDNNGNVIPVFHLHIKNVIGRTGDDGRKNTEIWVPLKYLSNFWKTPEMPLINCEVNLILT